MVFSGQEILETHVALQVQTWVWTASTQEQLLKQEQYPEQSFASLEVIDVGLKYRSTLYVDQMLMKTKRGFLGDALLLVFKCHRTKAVNITFLCHNQGVGKFNNKTKVLRNI